MLDGENLERHTGRHSGCESSDESSVSEHGDGAARLQTAAEVYSPPNSATLHRLMYSLTTFPSPISGRINFFLLHTLQTNMEKPEHQDYRPICGTRSLVLRDLVLNEIYM